MPLDDKYIVFRREDHEDSSGIYYNVEKSIPDAVVIRRQDVFAGPALHSYSHTIALAAKLISGYNQETSQHLREVADYFHEQAVLADAEGFKVPD